MAVGRGEVAEEGCGISPDVLLATEVEVVAVVKLSVARRMLKVRGDTGGEDGRGGASVELERVKCSLVVNRGVRMGQTEIRALRRKGPSCAMVLRSLGIGEADFRVWALGAMVELLAESTMEGG